MSQARPWSSEAVLMLAAAILTCLSMISLVGIAIHKVIPEAARDQWSTIDFLISSSGFHMAALVGVHVFLRWHGSGWREFLGLTQARPWRLAAIGIVAGVLVLGPILGLKWLVGTGLVALQDWLTGLDIQWVEITPEDQSAVQILERIQTNPQLLWMGVSAVVFAPLVEEVLFRGILYGHLRRLGHRRLGLWLSSVLFAVIHGNLVILLPLILYAMFLVWLYEATDSLVAPILCHAAFNLVNFILLIGWPFGG